MPSIGVFKAHLAGDAGGQGISVFHARNAGSTAFSGAEANTMGSSLRDMYLGATAMWNTITVTVDPSYEIIDVVSGAILSAGVMSSAPAAVTGGGGGNYAGGCGARIYWHTASILNRRIVRGATFLPAAVATQYGSDGNLTSTAAALAVTAALDYFNAAVSGGVTPVIYHRNPKGVISQGAAFDIVGASCSRTPGSLRSRRT